MNFAFLFKCLLFCLYNLHYVMVEAEPSDHKHHETFLDNPIWGTNVKNFHQVSGSEISEDATIIKPKKNRIKIKNSDEQENVTKKKKKGKKKLKKKKTKKIVKNIKGMHKGPVDILVHIKMSD